MMNQITMVLITVLTSKLYLRMHERHLPETIVVQFFEPIENLFQSLYAFVRECFYRSVISFTEIVRLGNKTLIERNTKTMSTTEAKLTGEVNKVDRSIDRLKTCPLLLRVFCNKNRHHLARLVAPFPL